MIRLAAVLALVLLSDVFPAAAAGQNTHAVSIIKLDRYRTRWSVNAEVGGRLRKLLLDTGGGVTVLSRAVAEEAGCRPWGRITGFRMFGDRGDAPHCDDVAVTIAGQRYVPAVVGIGELANLNPADSTLDGLIGLNLFDGQAVTFDFARGMIVVESDRSLARRIRGMRPLPIRLVREVSGASLSVMAAVPTAEGALWMELDSGNGGTILVSKPVARTVGLDPDREGPQSADFQILPGVHVRSDAAFTPDLIMDGNLGMPFLKGHIVTLDLRRGRAWIAPAEE